MPTPSRIACLALCALAWSAATDATTLRETRKKMGSRFEISVVHPEPAAAQASLDAAWAEIDRIESRISSWIETSETSALNRAAGQGPVVVSEELFGLIYRSLKLSRLTEGAFDITFAGAGRLWDFKSPEPALPDAEELAAALARVGYDRLLLDREASTVELPAAGMAVGFGAIGKGYAANRAAQVLEERGATGGLVSAGGDLVAFGLREDGQPWTVAIADPRHRDEVFAYLQVSEQAVVTSGDYESFVEIGGKRYAHILDPRTGYPVEELRSVTIVCPDAELADGLATGVFVLGRERGLALVNRLRGIEALVVDAEGEMHFSDNLRTLFSDGPFSEGLSSEGETQR